MTTTTTTDATTDTWVELHATITDRWGAAEIVYAGTVPTWAWDADRQPEWRRANRAALLGARTTDPGGWRVTYTVADRY